jgi:hypothetical protein
MTFIPPASDDYTFSEWLDSTTDLQVGAYGIHPGKLQDDALKRWVAINVLAATDELHEFLNEVPWKPWASGMKINREAAIGEIVDAMHFISNLLATFDVTGEELTTVYKAKQIRNAERQAEGYTGLDKCPGCHRDKAEVHCVSSWNVLTQEFTDFCGGCHTVWGVHSAEE